MAALILAVAFVPLALLVAKRLFSSLKPPRHRPLLFLSGGGVSLLFGLAAGYALHPAIQSGVVHFTSRRFGEIHANSLQQPLGYWTAILALYGIAVFLSGFGLAGIGLCFGQRQSR